MLDEWDSWSRSVSEIFLGGKPVPPALAVTTAWSSWRGGAGGSSSPRSWATARARGRAHVTLVDRSRTHLWKPLLHEVAAGSMDMHDHQLDYLAQARWHRFTFALGPLAGLDRKAKQSWSRR
jgi:hypothetical protein